MQPEFVVQTKNLCKAFAGKEVIHDCTMSVERGTIYGFWGKNGAGKTTVFKILLGLLKPTMGEVSVLGMDSSKNNLEVLRRTGSLIETPIFYEHLSMWSGNIRYLSGNRKPVSHLFRHTDFACNFILHFFSYLLFIPCGRMGNCCFVDWLWQTVCNYNNRCSRHYSYCHVPNYGDDFALSCWCCFVSCNRFRSSSNRMG